jgi:hypothetical protein
VSIFLSMLFDASEAHVRHALGAVASSHGHTLTTSARGHVELVLRSGDYTLLGPPSAHARRWHLDDHQIHVEQVVYAVANKLMLSAFFLHCLELVVEVVRQTPEGDIVLLGGGDIPRLHKRGRHVVLRSFRPQAQAWLREQLPDHDVVDGS